MNSVQLNFIRSSLKGKLVLQQEKTQKQNNKQDVRGQVKIDKTILKG